MIVTDSTLQGYSVVAGTWGLHMALLVACLFNYIEDPNPPVPQYDTTDEVYA